MSWVIGLFQKFTKVGREGGRGGQICLPRPSATALLSGRRQKPKKEKEIKKFGRAYIDQVQTPSHLVQRYISVIQIQAKLEFEGRRMKNPTRSTPQILSVCPSGLGWLSPLRCLGGFGSKFLEARRIYGKRFSKKKHQKNGFLNLFVFACLPACLPASSLYRLPARPPSSLPACPRLCACAA
jgi:hypothetical protein